MDYLIKESTLTGIADAIREKTGGTENLTTEGIKTGIGEVYDKGFADGKAQGGGSGGENKLPMMVMDNSATPYVLTAEDLAGATSIRQYAFYKSQNLTSVDIPNGVTSIGNYAFYDCKGTKGIKLPQSITSIGNFAFAGQYSDSGAIMCFVRIPENCTKIGDSAFQRTRQLYAVEVKAQTPPTLGTSVFLGFDSRYFRIVVPEGCGEAYKAATNWSSFAKYIVEANDIVGTTWRFNDGVNVPPEQVTKNILFLRRNTKKPYFVEYGIDIRYGDSELEFNIGTTWPGIPLVTGEGNTSAIDSRAIYIYGGDDVGDEAFATWLKANATQVEEEFTLW